MPTRILEIGETVSKRAAIGRRTRRVSPTARPRLEILEDRLAPAVLNTATPLTNQTLVPGQTAYLDLSANFIDSATTNGTVVTFNTSQGSFNVTLFDRDAPETVTNFLDYVEAGLYDNDLFQRLSNLSQTSPENPPTPYQILQGGGFSIAADASDNVTGFNVVPTFQPIQNESNDVQHPSIVGTLAMAPGGGPSSATSQFFFNLTDNSQALSGTNGDTVFGVVTDSTGLVALRQFASNYTPTDVTISTNQSDFYALPLANGFTPASNFPTGATTADLAIINSVTIASRPTGHLTYSILSNSNPSVLTATLGSNTAKSAFSANQLQLVAGNHPGSSVITLQITDSEGDQVTRQFTVTVAATTTTLKGAPDPSVAGQAVTFSATVAAVAPGDTSPTGTVTFLDGATTLGSGAVGAGGLASFTTSTLASGTHTVTAVYSGDTDYAGSTSAPLTEIVNAPAGTNQSWLARVYRDLLNRGVDPAGEAGWMGLLGQGVSRAAVVAAIEQSVEYRTDEVENLYHQLLKRNADPVGLNGFVSALGPGATLLDAEAAIAGSQEFFQNAGSSDQGFVNALYEDLLNRAPDPAGAAAALGALNRNASRQSVAAAILNSVEFHDDLIAGLYQQFLHREPDPFGFNLCTQALLNGASEESLIAVLLGSDEYFLSNTD
jgi:cyclophilin family peptidyl-prolyl cis-trans isomerase